jgi:hypothetical protein
MAMFKLLLSAFLLVCSLGCDPVRTVSQKVQLQILDAEADSPVSDVAIRLKEDFDPATVADEDRSKEEWEQHQREVWEQSPWHTGKTDANGVATVEVVHTAIDRSRGKEPPAERDIVSGRTYLVEIEDADVHRLEIKKDSRAIAGSVEVVILNVAEPEYQPTP